MNNPLQNKKYINHLKLLGLLATLLFMCLLTWMLLWNPYSLYFDRPENSSTPYRTRELYAQLAALFNFLVLLGLTIWSLIEFIKGKKFVIWTPLVGVVTFMLVLQMNEFYPESGGHYKKDGYLYLDQTFYGNPNTFKRFKSKQPLSDYPDCEPDYKIIVWEIDSMSTYSSK